MPVCISGMHRTGTSLVIRLLHDCGLYLGSEEDVLRDPSPGNPVGFWENKRFLQLNNALLSSLGGAWDVPPELEVGWESQDSLSALKSDAETLVEEFRDREPWGWKDPRNTLTFPFWKALLPGVKLVICVRNPLEVVQSLTQRGFSSEEFGFRLWEIYYRHILSASQPDRRIVTHYDSYFHNTKEELQRLITFLEISTRSARINQASASFSSQLRHHHLDWGDVIRGSVPVPVIETYLELCREAGEVYQSFIEADEEFESLGNIAEIYYAKDVAALHKFREEFLTAELEGQRRVQRRLRAELMEKTVQMQRLEAKEEEHLGEIELLRSGMEEIRVLADQLQSELDASRGEAVALADEMEARDRKLIHLEAKANALDSQLEHSESKLNKAMQKIQELRSREAELRHKWRVLNASSAVVLLRKFRRTRNWLLPKRTRRRALYNRIVKGFHGLLTQGLGVFRRKKPRPTSLHDAKPFSHLGEVGTDFSTYDRTYQTMLRTARAGQSGEFVPLAEQDTLANPDGVKLIAFYLPQFHPIPENDLWWGKGFTEWTNVCKAVPQFEGHYQPHLPGELGFYDLRVLDVQKRQIELAKKYGIYGYCYHYYWFNGKRLLERPLDQFLENTEMDFPFCICWANENWTRRWDGREDEILIAQEHSTENDRRFMEDIAPIMRDERYIHINGRPLLVIYRASRISDPFTTIEYWREVCNERGIKEPYLVAAQTFNFEDPRLIGFDAAVQFPPHNTRPITIKDQVKLLNSDYQGNVHDYQALVDRLTSTFEEPPYELFMTVFPQWDNEPRKPTRGRTFINATPAIYQRWLDFACKRAASVGDPDKRIVFINSWNEWAEGAHLEPDRRFGYAFLDATSEVLRSLKSGIGGTRTTNDANVGVITTIPRSATNMLEIFLKIYNYLLALKDPADHNREHLFGTFRRTGFGNIPFQAFHVGHGFCPGYHEFGEGPVKERWDEIEELPNWFNALNTWIEQYKEYVYPHVNPDARIVFVYRNPFDFVVSMYNHFEHHKSREDDSPVDLTLFIDRVMPQYLKSYVSHLEGRRRFPNAIKMVSYESLMADKSNVIREMLRFFGHPVGEAQDAAFQLALEYNRPEVMREIELFSGETLARDQKTPVDVGSHMRGGEVGKFRAFLAQEHIEQINQYLSWFDLTALEFDIQLDAS